jgi:transcriptional regulator with XRE-family HTH domain
MKNLKSIRKARNLTQQEVADAISVERVTYARYENGSRTPPVDNVIRLARFFNVTTDYLLGLSDDPQGYEQPATIAARPTNGMDPISPERLDEIIAQAVAQIRQEAAKHGKKEQNE